ncbi:uncharacterized protein EI97DRAFT_182897 [Westerdykella ornata]|uniref:Uncharacterized protein n=1 Tax=Westerdykella ornata TaxID=318751 RepID=A0A6A6JTF7_WESOR|nr:uncharacterized protein EI97DRAFT_182897 [Westerdykella ornata]KAF2279647.1 hypothetical protein EI97DRAFT_182897 [Westerdykella ornata]
MLSRASSDAGARLRRSKSASTVPHRPHWQGPQGPDVARQHALAAATTAFVRARVADAAEGEYFRRVELSGTKRTGNRDSRRSRFPERESSFRSLKHRRPQQLPHRQSQSSLAARNVPTCSPQGRPSTATNENLPPIAHSRQARQTASTPSTYGEICKARSMYYASNIQTGSPISRTPAKFVTTPSVNSPVPGGSAKPVQRAEFANLSVKSVSGTVQHLSESTATEPPSLRPYRTAFPNDSVDKARDKYLQEFQQQRQVRQRPSLFLAPFRKRDEKAKMTVCEEESTVVDVAAQLDMQPDPKTLKGKRSISGSLKNKLRKVFRRSSHRSSTIPIQQVSAGRDYFDSHSVATPLADGNSASPNVPQPEEDILHRVRSRSSSLESGRPALARPSSRGSNRSLRSDAGMTHATSRITSWGNSSIAETITQRTAKRLTVIHEAKDSVGSQTGVNSAQGIPRREPQPPPALAAFRDPMPMLSMMADGDMAVDPKRVFSALMKEIDSTKTVQTDHCTVQETPDQINRKSFVGASQVPLLGSREEARTNRSGRIGSSASIRLQRLDSSQRQNMISMQGKRGSLGSTSFKSLGRALVASIRPVTPSEPLTPSSPASDCAQSVPGSLRIPRSNSGGSIAESLKSAEGGLHDSSHRSIGFRIRPRRDRVISPPKGEMVIPSPEQIEARVQKSQGRWNAPLEGHGLIHSPIAEAAVTATVDKAVTNQSSEVLGQVRYSAQHTPKASGIFSPSVYSRNTDGMSILPNNSVMSLDTAKEEGLKDSPTGSAMIITSHSVKSFVVGTPKARRGSATLHNSRDWKAWLSHEISELTSLPKEEIAIHDRYQATEESPPKHRRESPEINEEEKNVVAQSTDDGSPSAQRAHSDGLETPTLQRISVDSITRKERESSPFASEFSTNSPLSRLSSPQRTGSSSQHECLHDIASRLPSYDDSPTHQPHSRPNTSGIVEGNKENIRSIISAPMKVSSLSASPVPRSLDCMRHFQPSSSPGNTRASSTLSQYAASAGDVSCGKGRSSAIPQPRIRVRLRPVSPEKLTVRPRSALDLRTGKPPSLARYPLSTQSSPQKNARPQGTYSALSRPMVTRAPQDPSAPDSVSFWASSGSLIARPSPNSSSAKPKRSYLGPGLSASSLVLNKEPAPAKECRGIDSVLGEGAGDRPETRSGCTTPGQRMADRFIKERSARSAAGSPAHETPINRSVTGSPVFV